MPKQVEALLKKIFGASGNIFFLLASKGLINL
jgi:hypothetical protein